MKDIFKISFGQAFARGGEWGPTSELSPLLLSLGWRRRSYVGVIVGRTVPLRKPR